MGILKLVNCARNVATLSPNVASPAAMVTSTAAEGFQLACFASPSPTQFLPRLAIAFNAGSRDENAFKNYGIAHLIQRSFGMSTADHSAVNLTRHMQQMGANVSCMSTRESIIYTMDVAPNLLPRACELMAEMVTQVGYFRWELDSTVNKLMRKDIELLHRRNLPTLAMELLHEAAFGKHPDGCGLGNSLWAPVDRVGSYTGDDIFPFISNFFTPSRCCVTLSGCESSEEGMDLLQHAKEKMHFHPIDKLARENKTPHGFVGGDIRRDLSAADYVYADIAWPTHGRDCPQRPAYDLLAFLLAGPMSRVAYSGRGSKVLGEDELATEGVKATAFNKVYRGHGLFGISLCSRDAKVMGERLVKILAALRTVNFTEEDLKKAKTQAKADLLMEFSDPFLTATDLTIQLSQPQRKYKSPSERAADLDAVTVDSLNKALKEALKSPKAALSVVGLNAYDVLPLNLLLSSS